MGLTSISGRHGRPGQPRAKAICDDCGREEVFPCPVGEEGQARKKIQNLGWSMVSGRLRCPKCEANRKVVTPMKPKLEDASEPPSPSREQKREIMALLQEVYDADAGRYAGGETDASVAEVLGFPGRPGWVAALREEFFGPDGGNEDIEALSAALKQVKGWCEEVDSERARISGELAALDQKKAKLEEVVASMLEDLGKIRRAVGPAARLRAGVK
ncbi:hypothetical protein [Pseudooceanicola sp. 200-1SW]|uniref:hypothetical protein n=1 Tax=Pseudooceanicola sp. 200-1SW TaxID=3425949 RepID=UPI003D7F55C7